MIRYVLKIAFLAIVVSAIDRTVFKSCSEREFCNNLRNYQLTDKERYSADVGSSSITNNVLTVPLSNDDGTQLTLLVTLLAGNKIRAKIEVPDSERFSLEELIIVEELEALPSSTAIDNSNLVLTPDDDITYPYKAIITPGPPFTVEFYYTNELQVVLNADRLLMNNKDDDKTFTFKVDFSSTQRLYGLLDHAWSMSLGDTNDGTEETMDPFRLRNSDSWGYEANSPMALYGSRPVVIGHRANMTSAIFLLNAAEQWIDTAASDDVPSAYFMVERADFDIFVLLGPTPKDLVRQFTGLTGKAHLPQIWTLGYHQSRFSYKSQDDVEEVVALLDRHDFSWDAIYLDGDHTDDYRWFRWNHTTFYNPTELFKNISATGRVAVSISDPPIKVDEDYDVYTGAKDKYFVKWADGTDYQGECWPLLSSWIDYLNQDAADYYSTWFAYDKFVGTDPTLAGIWNDMNEPSVFNDTLEKTLPWEVVHNGSVEHGDIHNIYGFLHVKATHKGLIDRDNGRKRPFILTRSHFAGSQRFAAVWTGDNNATWEHFSNSISECMTANMFGTVFCGADIGGFIGDPTEEMLQRWYQGAVWLPFFRGHSSRESQRREPYLFPEEVQDVLRNTIRFRYKHIPSFYTLFFEHTRTGDPIIRPLYYEYPENDDKDNHVLVGTDILGIAVTEPGVDTVEVLFPGNDGYWYRIDDDSWTQYDAGITQDISVDIKTSPAFYKAGSIIFRKDIVRKSAVAAKDDPYTLYVNLNKDQEAVGHLYVDDYYSFDYTDYNNYFYVKVSYIAQSGGVEIETIDGDSTGIEAYIQTIVVHEPSVTPGKLNTRKIYTSTAHGVPLKTINIVKELSTNKAKKLFIKL